MQTVQLAAKPRAEAGKKNTKAVRRRGNVPAIVYGHGMKPLALEIGARELHQVLHTKAGENVVISLHVDGVQLKESTCRIKEIQHSPVTEAIEHLDLTVISLTEKISVKVPLVVQNAAEALGVKEGGILDVVHHEIEIECLPTQIPEKIMVDVKDMKIGADIHAKDLQIPREITCKLNPEEVIIALRPPAKEEAPPAEEAAAAEPEVIEKGKKVEAEEGTAEIAAPKAAAPKTAKAEKKE